MYGSTLARIIIGLSVTSLASAQDEAKARLEREATAQAAEADRLFAAGSYAEALPLYQAERAVRARLGDKRYEAHALRGVACCASRLGDLPQAIEAIEEARRIDLELDDHGLAGFDGLILARILGLAGDHKRSIAEARASIARFDRASDLDHEAEARVQLARSLLELGKLAEAESEVAKAEAIARRLAKPGLTAEVHAIRGSTDRVSGRLERALDSLTAARRYRATEATEVLLTARLDREIVEVLMGLGRAAEAEATIQRAVQGFEKAGDPIAAAEAILARAGIQLDRGAAESALGSAREARSRFAAIPDPLGEIEAVVAQAHAARLLRDRSTAIGLIDEAIRRSDRVHRDQPEERIRLLLLGIELARESGDKRKTDELRHRALRLVVQVDDETLRESYRMRLDAAPRTTEPPIR
ncbi:MAG: tetratricopeptide repeat protein [Isosphaeraceae bacterium]|nr:tetratricopeptide repeat protein [Isosphaeraceae bacterium]